MLLVIDNYDSFTYNLVQYCAELGADPVVVRNDVPLSRLVSLQPRHVLISPGPCSPREAGTSVDAIRYFAGRVPLLGVCLGHQALAYAFGANIARAPVLMHGKTSLITHNGDALFAGVPSPFEATRYHSLIVERASLLDSFEVTAECDGLVMGVRHKPTGAVGVQFHPESVLTLHGKTMLRNFLAS